MKIEENPSFVDFKGVQDVGFYHGAWELVWRDEAPAGQFIFGFDVPSVSNRGKVAS